MSKISTQKKSVFLYGKPTQCKKEHLLITQREYTILVNHFIQKMISDKKYYLDLLNNNNQSPLIRALEKTERQHHLLGSAYGQNAIDHAVKELHNYLIRIKNKLYGFCCHRKPELLSYVESVALINVCINDQNELDVLHRLIKYEEEKQRPSKSKIEFYEELIIQLNLFTEDERSHNRAEICYMFMEQIECCKIPSVKQLPLQLDTRLCTIEKATDIEADYVINVKLLGSKERIDIPLTTSNNSLRRLNQFKNCSPSITVTGQNIKVIIPIEKKIKEKEIKTKRIVGIDMGITDLLFTSDGKRYGSFSGMNAFYESSVEPKLKLRSNLRNLMKSYQKKLKQTDDSARRTILKRKIYNIACMLNGNKNINKCKRRYSHAVDIRINEAVNGLFNDIKQQKNIVVSMESLDITDFDRGKTANKRDSSWIRGRLAKKLQDSLTWHGFSYIEVDPAYTSKACPNCYNIDANSRKYKSFECTVCRHKSDADYNASINIANRALDNELKAEVEKYKHNTFKRHSAIRKLFQTHHEKWLEENQITVAI